MVKKTYRRKMCYRGCTCEPCVKQRATDRRYIEARTGDPSQYPSALAVVRRANKYGLTVEQLQQMEAERESRCDICGNPETVLGSTGKVKSLAVDHCHDTGRIRGLLCNNCNRALGLFGKAPGLLERALQYLKEAEG